MSGRFRAAALLVALAAVLLAGCSPAVPGGGTESAAPTAAPASSPTPTPAPPDVSLMLTGSGGQPLTGAAVTLTDPNTLAVMSEVTDEAGRADFYDVAADTVFLSADAAEYLGGGQVVDLSQGPAALTLALESLPQYQAWVMAFMTRDDSNAGRIYLAQSGDGVNWELAEDGPVAQGTLPDKGKYKDQAYEALVVTMSPDAAFVGGLPYVYYDDQIAWPDLVNGGWVRKTVNQDAGDWNPEHELIAIDTFGFFDHQVCAVNDGGRLYLLGKNRVGYGYSDMDIVMGVAGSVADSVFGYAVEAESGAGQAFVCPEDRYLLALEGNYEIKEPDWFAMDEGWGMLASDTGGLRLFRAAELTGAYAPAETLPDGVLYSAKNLAGACVDYDPGTGLYSIYVSLLNDTRVLMARTDTLDTPLTEEDFQTVFDSAILPEDQRNIVFLGNPGICRSETGGTDSPDEPGGPYILSLADARQRSFTVGMGSTGSGSRCDETGYYLRMMGMEQNQGNIAALVPTAYFTDIAVSVEVSLPPGVDTAMAGLSYCWQDTGRYMGGYCFRAGTQGWELIHAHPGYYLDGSYLTPMAPEQVNVVASGTWNRPFTEGRLTVIFHGGVHYFFRDGQYAGQAFMKPFAPNEYNYAEHHVTGYPGVYVKAVTGSEEYYRFSDFIITDLTGKYAGP